MTIEKYFTHSAFEKKHISLHFKANVCRVQHLTSQMRMSIYELPHGLRIKVPHVRSKNNTLDLQKFWTSVS